VNWYAEALLGENRFAEGVAVYEQYAEKVLAAQGQTLVKNLSAMVTRVKNSSKALLSLKNLFQKAGDTSHEGEITELLAHAYVEEGELNKAKDLYKQLADNEPENPLHAQNYKQVLAKLGEDTSSQMTAEQGAQAIMAEELEHKAPAIKQDYPQETAQAVQQALTDAELYESYNVPGKVVAPLEAGLQHAPRDVRINQKLAAAYAKAQRYVDAARCYNTLQEVFAEAGHQDEAKKYAEMAGTYLSMPTSVPVEAGPAEPVKATAPGADDSSINLISFSDMQEAPAAAVAAEIAVEAAPVVAAPEVAIQAPVESAPAAAESHEIAIDDWESMLSVEAPPAAPAPEAPIGFEVPVPAPEAAEVASFRVSPPGDGTAVAEFSFESATAEAAPAEAPVEAPVEEISIPVEAPPMEVAPPPPVAKPAPPPPPVAKPAPPSAPPPKAKPAAAASADDDILGDLVSDLEDSLGDSFLEEKAPAKPAAAVPPKVAPPPPAPASMPAAAASAAAPAPAKSAAPPIPAPVAQQDAASALSDIFDEFKEDAEATADEAEDPDTHYNLGIAFKEMGLLDEAIGELQKVAKAIDQGQPFSQQMQAFTWLAQCLVDKGVPQAAVRWYEKALKVPEIDEESKLAVYYDLGNAYEMAGNRQKAHDTFLEVYSSNIDYRDVADRIKALKN
jgi:tetratricopeptide (TPR) repeat protein